MATASWSILVATAFYGRSVCCGFGNTSRCIKTYAEQQREIEMICSKMTRRPETERMGITSGETHISEIRITKLPLSKTTAKSLERAGATTLGDIVIMTEEELREIPKLGNKSVTEIKNVLQAIGLTFSPVSIKNTKRNQIIETTLEVLARKDPELKKLNLFKKNELCHAN